MSLHSSSSPKWAGIILPLILLVALKSGLSGQAIRTMQPAAESPSAATTIINEDVDDAAESPRARSPKREPPPADDAVNSGDDVRGAAGEPKDDPKTRPLSLPPAAALSDRADAKWNLNLPLDRDTRAPLRRPAEGGGFKLNGRNDVVIDPTSPLDGATDVLVIDGAGAKRVEVRNVKARGVTIAGIWADGPTEDLFIHDCVISLKEDARERTLRTYVRRQLIRDCTFEMFGGKSTAWFPFAEQLLIDRCIFDGCEIRIGARPQIIGASGEVLHDGDRQGGSINESGTWIDPPPGARDVIIRNCTIRHFRGDHHQTFCFWPGCDRVHLENLIIETDRDCWASIDDRAVTNLTWRNITMNGRRVDNDWSVVKIGGSLTPDDMAARGIGPVE